MALDLSNDWQVIDDLQSLTYTPKVNEGVYAPGFSVPNVYWEELNQLDYLKNPRLLEQQARAVHLWASQMSGQLLSGTQVVPKLDDKLTDAAGSNWYATRVEKLDLDANGIQRYRVTCLLGM